MNPIPIGRRVFGSLSETQEALSGPVLLELKDMLANPESTAEQFLGLLSSEQILGIVVSAADNPLRDQLPEAIRRDLVPLTELIDREIPTVRMHAGFVEAVKIVTDQLGESEQKPAHDLGGSFKSITGFSGFNLLLGDREPLHPMVRLLLKSDVDGENFEFTASPSDLAFLAKGFAEILAEMLMERTSLAEKGVIEILNKGKIAQRIAELEVALQKIKQLAPQFGIMIPKPEEPLLPESMA